jgi:glyoxylase-like metal-dependent hydrolase (beta-lactamase superfamily II)
MNGELETQTLGAVTVLFGERRGRYPQGNSLLIAGGEESVIVDPSLGLLPRAKRLPRVDRVLHSHCHEDHIAGSHLFPHAPWHFHRADLPGILSLDGMMKIYGYAEPSASAIRASLETQFHYQARGDAIGFGDGDVFDLGSGVRVRVIHAPGHTRGHCFFWIEPDDILYLADVDLSSFGPYYGDAWSDLRDFERTLAWLRQLEPRCWVTFHHIGVLADQSEFLSRLDRFEGVIAERENRLLGFLTDESRSLEEIVRHRFVYRPHDEVAFADAVERRTMSQHLDRLVRASRVAEVEPGRFLRYS